MCVPRNIHYVSEFKFSMPNQICLVLCKLYFLLEGYQKSNESKENIMKRYTRRYSRAADFTPKIRSLW